MKTHRCMLWIALTVLYCTPGLFGQTKSAPPPKRPPNPALLPIVDQPGLPRVLLIGDSISIGYTIPVREALAGKANVHRPKDNCGPTIRGLEKLDEWLGRGRWDVIHFNFGLHDLRYIDGKHQVPVEEYETNLRQITERLKKTGAVLVWCSTTPVPDGCEPNRKAGEEVEYNAVAKKIMDENHIAIDDLCSFSRAKLAQIQIPKNVHFTPDGSKVLAGQVAASILKALDGRKN
jgi:lysophospholipase L1-like esterase